MEPVHLPMHKSKTTKASVKIKDAEDIAIFSSKNNLMNLESLRKIISISSSEKNGKALENESEAAPKWQTVMADLLHELCANEKSGNETVLLAAHAYLSLRRALEPATDFEMVLSSYLDLNSSQIIDFKRIFLVNNVELFRLTISHGFLQANIRANVHQFQVYRSILKIVQPHCISYTHYTYFAFKILQMWMLRSSAVGLWSGDSTEFEAVLEPLLFSNWDNAICKQNVVGLFSAYLAVVKDKHEDYLPYLFHSCVERISWCHVTKYTILAEICSAMDCVQLITEAKFVSNLFNSLTVSHLCNASTKVYSVISNKLSMNVWQAVFGDQLKNYVTTWEAEKKYSSLQVLCKRWIEPIIKIHREILPFLLECCDEQSVLFRSHLLRIAKKCGIVFPREHQKDDVDLRLLNHEEESVRLNAFAAHCYAVGAVSLQTDLVENFAVSAVKHFLFSNATASTTYLREGSFNYFKIFLSNLLRQACLRKDSTEAVSFLEWLHEFELDCVEIGSCYQRKIFGLQLYKITLQFLQSNDCTDPIVLKDPHFREAIKYGPLLKKEMEDRQKWKFTSKKSVVLLFKLVLDPASDVRGCATSIIIDFFDASVITDSEKKILFVTALNKCNSHKFFETESGAYLFKILTMWYPLSKINADSLKFEENCKPHSPIREFYSYTRFLLKEAMQQLILAKKDILKAATQNAPFYGIVCALLMIGLDNGPECHFMNSNFLEEILNMAEGAVKIFLITFSVKSSNLEHSSSFKEMSLAIDEAIKNSEINYEFDELALSPAQQSIITCVWRSLKILCELAVAIAKNELATDSTVRRAVDLIVMVSVKCRHKGAIESAGVAIASLTRHLCKKQRNVELLENHLKRLLSDNFSLSINLTRRGAGLTILFHKMVASDIRPDRPLLHLAVNSLLQFLKKRLTSTLSTSSRADELSCRDSCKYDEPCAMQLHFLKSLVADRQLYPQLSQYLEQICLVCFEYIPSQVFTIRNASFQLFGAIAMRLVGQNTGAREVDFAYGFSINHFASHFPQLAGYVLLSLQKAACSDGDWQSTTSVIHILALLSKMFYAGCELVDGAAQTYVRHIRSCLWLFLGSPVACVRSLAARSLAATTGRSELESKISRLENTRYRQPAGFNRLNGELLALECLHERLAEELRSTSVRHSKSKSPSEVRRNLELNSETELMWRLWSRRYTVERSRLCYSIEAQLLRLSREFKIVMREEAAMTTRTKTTADEGSSSGLFDVNLVEERTKPGFFDFVDELVKLFVNRISCRSEDPASIKSILGAGCVDLGVSFTRYATSHSRGLLMACVDFALENFDTSHQHLLEAINAYANESIRSIMRSGLAEFQYLDISKLKSFASRLEATFTRTSHLSELLVFVHVLSLRNSGSYDFFEDLISCVSKEKVTLASYFGQPEAVRQLVAKALEVLLYNFDRLNSRSRLVPYLASLVLLKDEVDSIREAIRDSVVDKVILELELSKTRVMDELVCYILLLNAASEKTVLGADLSRSELVGLFNRYLSTIELHSGAIDIENPFDDDNITPYNEDSKLINFVVLCAQQKVSKDILVGLEGTLGGISDMVFYTKNQLIETMNINFDNLQDFLNIKNDVYLARKLQVVSEVYLK